MDRIQEKRKNGLVQLWPRVGVWDRPYHTSHVCKIILLADLGPTSGTGLSGLSRYQVLSTDGTLPYRPREESRSRSRAS